MEAKKYLTIIHIIKNVDELLKLSYKERVALLAECTDRQLSLLPEDVIERCLIPPQFDNELWLKQEKETPLLAGKLLFDQEPAFVEVVSRLASNSKMPHFKAALFSLFSKHPAIIHAIPASFLFVKIFQDNLDLTVNQIGATRARDLVIQHALLNADFSNTISNQKFTPLTRHEWIDQLFTLKYMWRSARESHLIPWHNVHEFVHSHQLSNSTIATHKLLTKIHFLKELTGHAPPAEIIHLTTVLYGRSNKTFEKIVNAYTTQELTNSRQENIWHLFHSIETFGSSLAPFFKEIQEHSTTIWRIVDKQFKEVTESSHFKQNWNIVIRRPDIVKTLISAGHTPGINITSEAGIIPSAYVISNFKNMDFDTFKTLIEQVDFNAKTMRKLDEKMTVGDSIKEALKDIKIDGFHGKYFIAYEAAFLKHLAQQTITKKKTLAL